MADVLRHPSLSNGSTLAALKTRSESAKLALAAERPTWRQAREAVLRLLSSWSEELVTDQRRDGIAEIFMHFPLAVVDRCADRWNGIACSKIRDARPERSSRDDIRRPTAKSATGAKVTRWTYGSSLAPASSSIGHGRRRARPNLKSRARRRPQRKSPMSGPG